MSSEQLIRKENKTHDQQGRNIHGGQGELPQVAHYESLTVMDAGTQPAPGSTAVVHRVVETIHGTAAGGIQDQSRTQRYEAQGRNNQSGGATLASSKIGGQQEKHMNYGATQKDGQYAHEYRTSGDQNTVRGAGAGTGRTSGITDAASYLGDAAVAGKNVAVETGKSAGEFAGKAAGVAKDAALVAGYGAAELAGEATTGVAESMENLNYGVSGVIEGTAAAVEAVAGTAFGWADTMVDAGIRGVSYLGGTAVTGKDIAVGTGKTTAMTTVELGGKAAGVAKDAALTAGWGVVELASDTQEGLRESMEGINTRVGGVIESTAVGAEIVADKALGATGAVAGAGKKGASYIGGTMARGAAELASETQEGVKGSVEGFNAGVGGLIETAAVGAEIVGGKVLGAAEAAVDLGKKGVGYFGEKAVAGKDITGEFVGKAAGVAKDATLAAGWGAAELASDTAAGVTESMETLNEGVAVLVEGTASATENAAKNTFDTLMDVGKKGVDVGRKGVVASGKATTNVVGKGAGVVKDAALAAGRGAAELASGTAEGWTESMDTLNEGVGVVIEGTARATEAVAQKTYGTAVDMAVTSKDIALGTGKATAGAVGVAAGMAADAGIAAGRGAVELAVGTTKATAGAAGMVAGVATDAALVAGRGAADLAVGTTKATVGAVGMAADVAFAAGRNAAELAVDATKATAGAAGVVAGAATDAALATGRGAAELAASTAKASAGAVGKAAGVVGRGASEFASDEAGVGAGYVRNGAGRNTAGYGVQTNVGPDIVIERETITVDFKNQAAKETKKEYKKTGYYRK